jgi:hypothetical protein
MPVYNPGTFSLPLTTPTTMQFGITYALLPVPSKLLAGVALLSSTTYNGTFSPLANSNIAPGANVNGGFVKVAASPTSVTITRNPFKK